MAEFKRIRIDQIHIPERLRAVEEEHALAIAQSIVEHGLLNPITVRQTPAANKGKTPYTLVAGAHRLRAEVINEETEIDAMVVEADQIEAQMVEVVENLFRNDLSVIDKAIFVQTYRDVWEQKYGKITPGGDRKSKGKVSPMVGADRCNLLEILGTEVEAGSFSAHVAERMGVSKDAVKLLNRIAQNITPRLRQTLRGTPTADNQSMLLKLAKIPVEEQVRISYALPHEPDITKVLAFGKPPKVETNPQDDLFNKLSALWKKADDATQRRFLEMVGETQDLSYLGGAA